VTLFETLRNFDFVIFFCNFELLRLEFSTPDFLAKIVFKPDEITRIQISCSNVNILMMFSKTIRIVCVRSYARLMLDREITL
jgi:hypothetical protein